MHEGTAREKKLVYQLDPAKPDKATVVHLDGGRRKTVLPYIDPVAAVMSAARGKLFAKPKNPAKKPTTAAKPLAATPSSSDLKSPQSTSAATPPRK